MHTNMVANLQSFIVCILQNIANKIGSIFSKMYYLIPVSMIRANFQGFLGSLPIKMGRPRAKH